MPKKNILESDFILRILAATLKNKNNLYSRFKFKSLKLLPKYDLKCFHQTFSSNYQITHDLIKYYNIIVIFFDKISC